MFYRLFIVLFAFSTICCGKFSNGSTSWSLKNGTKVKFYIRKDGVHPRETKKVLEILLNDSRLMTFNFGENHAGYKSVELRTNYDQSIIWIVNTSGGYNSVKMHNRYIGCCYDFNTNTFYGQSIGTIDGKNMDKYPPSVDVFSGEVICND